MGGRALQGGTPVRGSARLRRGLFVWRAPAAPLPPACFGGSDQKRPAGAIERDPARVTFWGSSRLARILLRNHRRPTLFLRSAKVMHASSFYRRSEERRVG